MYNDKSPIKTDITISLNAAPQMLEDAQKAFENGYDILKVKLGSDIKIRLTSPADPGALRISS